MKNNNLLKGILKKLTCFVLASFMMLQIVPEGAIQINAAGSTWSGSGYLQVKDRTNGKIKVSYKYYSNVQDLWKEVKRWRDDDYVLDIWMTSDWQTGDVLECDEATISIYMQGHVIDRGLTEKNATVSSGFIFEVTDDCALWIDGGRAEKELAIEHKGSLDPDTGVFKYNVLSDKEENNVTITGGLITGGSNDFGAYGGYYSMESGAISVSGGSQVSLMAVTIAGNQNYNQNSVGGAVTLYSRDDALHMFAGSKIMYNYAEYGGGVYSDGRDTEVVLSGGSEISHNKAGKDGGAIYLNEYHGAVGMHDNSSISDNYAGNNGGAIYGNDDKLSLYFLDSTKITNNTAGNDGGAIYYSDNADDSYIQLEDNTEISYNTAGGDGGAIYNNTERTRIYSDDKTGLVSHNIAGGDGGAIYNKTGTHFELPAFYYSDQNTITGLTIDNNESKGKNGGGGIFNDYHDGISHYYISDTNYSLAVINCNITNNTSENGAGGVYFYAGRDEDLLQDCIITGNKTNAANGNDFAGGVAYDNTLELRGTLNITGNYFYNATNSSYRVDSDLKVTNSGISGTINELSSIGIYPYSTSQATVLSNSSTYYGGKAKFPQEAFFSNLEGIEIITKNNTLKVAAASKIYINFVDAEGKKEIKNAYEDNGRYFTVYYKEAITKPEEDDYYFVGWKSMLGDGKEVPLDDYEKTTVIYSYDTQPSDYFKEIVLTANFNKKIKKADVTLTGTGDSEEIPTLKSLSFTDKDGETINSSDYFKKGYKRIYKTLKSTTKGNTSEGNKTLISTYEVRVILDEFADTSTYFSKKYTGTLNIEENLPENVTVEKVGDLDCYYSDSFGYIMLTQMYQYTTVTDEIPETQTVTVNAYDINGNKETLLNDNASETYTVKTNVDTIISAPIIENYQFDHWEDSNNQTINCNDDKSLTVKAVSNTTYKAIYKPVISNIVASIDTLVVGQKLPTKINSITATIAGVETTDIVSATIYNWKKSSDGKKWLMTSKSLPVSEGYTYKCTIKPSIQNGYQYVISDKIEILINSDELTKADIKNPTTTQEASAPSNVASLIRPLQISNLISVYKETNDSDDWPEGDPDGMYLDYVDKVPDDVNDDENLSAVQNLSDITVDYGITVSNVTLPTQVTIKLKNGTTTTAPVTWKTTFKDSDFTNDDGNTIEVKGNVTYEKNDNNVSTEVIQTIIVNKNPNKLNAPKPDAEAGTYNGSVYLSLISNNNVTDEKIYYKATVEVDGKVQRQDTEAKEFDIQEGVIKIQAVKGSTKKVTIETWVEAKDKIASTHVTYEYTVTNDTWYTAKFDFNGGSDKDVGSGIYTLDSIEIGDCIYFKDEPTRSGYKFMGWLGSDGNTYQIEDIMKLDENSMGESIEITFKALWESLTPDTSDSTNIPLWAGTTLVSLAIVGLLIKKKIEDQLN